MEYINIDEKDLVELYGASDNEMVYKMMGLMLEQTYPKATTYLIESFGDDLLSRVEFLKNFTSYFNMVGLSVVTAKIELLEEKIKSNVDRVLLDEAFVSLEQSIVFCETLIEEYRENIKNNL